MTSRIVGFLLKRVRVFQAPPAALSASLFVMGTLLCGALQASPVIDYQLSSLGTQNGVPAYRYTYFISGIDFFQNEELDIRFDAAKYGTLTAGHAGSDFDLELFNPNSPPGSPGDYSALARVDHASLVGTFNVDFTWLATGLPGPQVFFLYDDRGPVSVQVASGTTTPLAVVAGAPEPGTVFLLGLGLLSILAGQPAKRYLRFRQQSRQ